MTGTTAPGPRLAVFYGAVFGAVGIQLPFWPVWLEARGLDAGAIGLVLAAGLWARVAFSPVAAWIADRSGERRRVMVGLAAGAVVAAALFALAHGFWPILALTALTAACFTALMPLGDNLTMLHARRGAVDYGRVRLWGSLTFILAAVLGGRLVGYGGADVILVLLVGTYALVLLACLLLPKAEPGAPDGSDPVRPSGVRRLLTDPRFLLLLASAGLIQASHSAYYGFATLHWHAAGLSGPVIGWLWAEGVIAEIVLFALAGRLAPRIGPAPLLALAGALTVARWVGTGLSTDLALLALMQALHAASFGACHLAVMHKIRDEVAPDLQASAQGAYASLSALLFGVLTPLSGRLYGAFAGGAFLAMAATALAGTALALALRAAPSREAQPRAGPGS